MIYTAKCDHFATGEGRTKMFLVGEFSNDKEVREKFALLFDRYYLTGAEITEGINFEGFEDVIPEEVRKIIQSGKCMFHYHTLFHCNFS
jgi:hypothetical protein